jgi:addiction module HigA family antidote
MEMYNPCHAGELLRLHMKDRITVSALAKHLGMTRANLSMILNGRLGVSALTAIKLGEAFPHTDARFWMDAQTQYDLSRARRRRRTKVKPLKYEFTQAA